MDINLLFQAGIALTGLGLTALGIIIAINKISSSVSSTISSNFAVLNTKVEHISKAVDRHAVAVEHGDRRMALQETSLAVLSSRVAALEAKGNSHGQIS